MVCKLNTHMKLSIFSFLLFLSLSTVAKADDSICPDRPGAGNSVCTVDSRHVQFEIGTDQQAVRFGLAPKFEFDISNTSFAAKYLLVNVSKFSMSTRPSVDFTTGYATIEFPMQYLINNTTNITIDPQFIEHDKTAISIDVNRNVTSEITVTAEFASQSGKKHVNGYITWVPKKFNNWQLDVGIANGRGIIGISKKF